MELVRLLIHFQLAFQYLVCRQCVCFRRMGILEILAAAIKSVRRLQVPGLHIMINGLHVDHLLRMKVNVDCSQCLLCFLFLVC